MVYQGRFCHDAVLGLGKRRQAAGGVCGKRAGWAIPGAREGDSATRGVGESKRRCTGLGNVREVDGDGMSWMREQSAGDGAVIRADALAEPEYTNASRCNWRDGRACQGAGRMRVWGRLNAGRERRGPPTGRSQAGRGNGRSEDRFNDFKEHFQGLRHPPGSIARAQHVPALLQEGLVMGPYALSLTQRRIEVPLDMVMVGVSAGPLPAVGEKRHIQIERHRELCSTAFGGFDSGWPRRGQPTCWHIPAPRAGPSKLHAPRVPPPTA
ncbi:hypothetical protein DFH09DRAFT_1415902 [Mycena vulgaris]|nr:hypothetical protein DFH09DRAFT_1415902 [Mycena vulgaris]